MYELPVRDVQCDEIWGFVGCKEARNSAGDPKLGDAYCFVAIERNTKLVITWHIGQALAWGCLDFRTQIGISHDRKLPSHY